MSTRVKLIIAGVIFLVLVVLVVNIGLEIKYENDLAEINKSVNTELNSYFNNKGVVEDYLQVYNITDENSYQYVKSLLYDSFSNELQKEYFPTVNYKGVDLHNLKTELIEIKGTNYKSKPNIFLIKYILSGINYEQEITNLITIEDGIITKVERIS